MTTGVSGTAIANHLPDNVTDVFITSQGRVITKYQLAKPAHLLNHARKRFVIAKRQWIEGNVRTCSITVKRHVLDFAKTHIRSKI